MHYYTGNYYKLKALRDSFDNPTDWIIVPNNRTGEQKLIRIGFREDSQS